MPTSTRRTTLIVHALTLLFGAVVAIAIGLAGYVQLSWLGFVLAALLAETPRGRRVLAGAVSRRLA